LVRLISGVLLAALFFTLIWFGNAYLLLLVALGVGVLALHEYLELMRQLGAVIPRVATAVATMAVIAIVPFPYVAPVGVMGVGVVVIAMAAMVQQARLKPGPAVEGRESRLASSDSAAQRPEVSEHASPNAPPEPALPDPVRPTSPSPAGPGFSRASTDSLFGALTGGFALLYIGVPLGALVSIHIFGGRGAVVLLVATIVISDTAQYYSGRAFGRHPMAPRLSPKKTIEGAVGGFVVAPVFLYFAGPYLIPVTTPLMIAPLGLVLVACGIAGDLFESMIKRAADLKDSSALIPGHGGILDRIDALLFATPPFYMFVRWAYTA
jgi:CDP-diglyceride synthetase